MRGIRPQADTHYVAMGRETPARQGSLSVIRQWEGSTSRYRHQIQVTFGRKSPTPSQPPTYSALNPPTAYTVPQLRLGTAKW